MLFTLTGVFFHKIRSTINYIPSHIDEIKLKIQNTKIEKKQLFSKLDEIKEGANTILSRAERVSKTVKKVSKNITIIHRLDLKKLITTIIKELDKKNSFENIKLEFNYEEKPIIINTFKSLLKEALLNIIYNAIESMKDVGGKLIINLRLDIKTNKYSILEIIDTGIGIKKSDQKKIFEIHFSTKKDSFGYGLWFVDMVFKAAKIKYTIESKIDKGTQFTLYIPLRL